MHELARVVGAGAMLLLLAGCEAKDSERGEEPELTHRLSLPEGEHGYGLRWADGTRCLVVYGAFNRPSGISCEWRH
jgi:hypothetical protein